MKTAEQLYAEAINLSFLERFHEASYVTEIGLAPLVAPAGNIGLQLMVESANAGYAPAQYQLGIYCLFEDHHRESALHCVEGQNPNFSAQITLQRQEADAGIKWLQNAANGNHADACLLLGDIFSEHVFCGGITSFCASNDQKAFGYYTKSSQLGNRNAMYRLGRCYYHGWGTSENNDAAFSHFCRAQNAGCELMWSQLGECYMGGYGTKQDIPKAIEMFERSLNSKDHGFHNATKLKLACIYQGQFGFRHANIQRAYDLAYSISADSDEHVDAQGLLADMPNAEAEYRKWKTTSEQRTSKQQAPVQQTRSKSSGGCYIATAIYGSYDCPEVWTLRRYRDTSLGSTWYGRTFIRIYYAISPTLVKWFGHAEWFKRLWKPMLDKMVVNLNQSGIENTPYKDRPQ